MTLTSKGLLYIVDTRIIRIVYEELERTLTEYERDWDDPDLVGDEEKQGQAEMLLYYQEAIELYNEYTHLKTEPKKFPKTEEHKNKIYLKA